MRRTEVCVILIFLLSINSCLNSFAKNKNVRITEIGEFSLSGTLFDIQVVDNIAYIAEYDSDTFYIFDVSDPTNPTSLANYSVNLPHYFEVVNDIAYITAWDQGVQVIDVSDPSNPTKISHYKNGTTGYQTIFGNYMLVGFSYSTDIVDISDPSNPQWICTFNEDRSVMGSYIDGDIVYLLSWNWTLGNSWIYTYNISDIMNPVELGYFDQGNVFVDIEVIDNIAFVANYQMGLMIIDFTDFSNPEVLEIYTDRGTAAGLYMEDDILFIANENRGISILDVSDITEPSLLADYWDGGSATELDIKDNLIFVGDTGEGLEILQVEGLSIFETSGFSFISSIMLLLTIVSMIKKRKKKEELKVS
jgi:hypothetical protein